MVVPLLRLLGMKVRLVQVAASADPLINREIVANSVAGVDLVVFPEAMSRDFAASGASMAEHAELLDGPFVSALRTVGTPIVAGMFESNPADPQRPFNTMVVLHGDQLTAYRKIHLYDSFGFKESDAISAGPVTPTVVPFGGLNFGLMTCYDLRFPEMARELVRAGADVLMVISAWVAGPRKVEHWETMLRARAIENVSFVVAVGQPGPKYVGHSQVISPLGDVLARLEGEPGELAVDLDPGLVAQARRDNPSLENRRW